MTAPAADEVTSAEQTLTATEALNQGWFVAEFFRGEELIRRYGRTAEEARARLLSEFEACVTLRTPEGVMTTPVEQPMLDVTPDFIDDGCAYWLGPLDVVADPTGTPPPVISVGRHCRLSREQALRLAGYLTAAAAYCSGGA